MSVSERFIREYVGAPKLVDLLKAILDINLYEALCVVALALTTESSASKIADVTGIPRSKIYQTLTSLGKKGIVEKHKDGFKLDYSQIIPIICSFPSFTSHFRYICKFFIIIIKKMIIII